MNWKDIQEEVYSNQDHDGTLSSRFKAAVYNGGYRPDKPSTWESLKSWWRKTPSMSGQDKANALGESLTKLKKKLNAGDSS